MIIKSIVNDIWTIEDNGEIKELTGLEVKEQYGDAFPLYFIKDPVESKNKSLIKLFEQGDCI